MQIEPITKTNITSILVSVVILTFNQEKMILNCLDSVRKQTYSNIELIISDDASTDNTCNIIEEWLQQNRKQFFQVLVIKNVTNIGISANHTLAVSKANGKYIKYLGGDDILHPMAIEKMLNYVEANKYDWIVCRIATFQDSIQESRNLKISPVAFWAFMRGRKIQLFTMFYGNYIPAPGVFIRKQVLEEVGFFGDYYRTREDYHTWLSIMSKGYSVKYLAETLVYWRRHKDSVSNSIFQTSNARWFIEGIHTIDNELIPRIPRFALAIRFHVWLVKKSYMKILSRGVKYSKWDCLYSYVDPLFLGTKILEFFNYIGLINKEMK